MTGQPMGASGPTPSELADIALYDDFKAQYQSMLNTIDADLTSLADANWSGLTAAGRAEVLRTVDQHLLIGVRRILKALSVPVRYARGE